MGNRPLAGDTLCDEHLIGTASGVMRSRAERRLQEPAAMCAMLFTPWSPHLNLPGRPRLQRPAFEEPIESGTLPGFIEIPTAPTKNPKSETLKSTPGDAEQSTKRRRQEVTLQNHSQRPHPLVPSQTRQCKFLIHNYRNLHVRCLPLRERRQYPQTSKISRFEHSVGHCRWRQQN